MNSKQASDLGTRLDQLLAEIGTRDRARVWSILITIFGDAIVPRGGIVALSTLQKIAERMGHGASAVRAALSRLTSEGWLERTKVGRQSFYSLGADGHDAFESATRQIYAAGPPEWQGGWELFFGATISEVDRQVLTSAGFGSLSGTLFLRPKLEGRGTPIVERLARVDGDMLNPGNLPDLAREAWPLGKLEADYERFVADFTPLAPLTVEASPLEAMALRTLTIHQFRRIVLRDPNLPLRLTGPEWGGAKARDLARTLFLDCQNASESWLDQEGETPDGKLPPASLDLRLRFQIEG